MSAAGKGTGRGAPDDDVSIVAVDVAAAEGGLPAEEDGVVPWR